MRRYLIGSRLLPRVPDVSHTALSALVLLLLSCGGDDSNITAPSTGTLTVTTTTTGEAASGYTVTLDGGSPQAIGANASVSFTEVVPGPHSVALTGLPAGCTVTGDNPRTVAIEAGATTTETFAVTCTAATGEIQVSTVTSGPAPLSYGLLLDGTDQGAVGATQTGTLEGVAVGSHLVGLSAIPATCQVQGPNPQSVTVSEGVTASVSFSVTCTAPPAQSGTLTITTNTTGSDPDGFVIQVDAGPAQPIAINTTINLVNITAGTHSIQLGGLAAGCTVSAANPQTVTVPTGGTVSATFSVTCGTPGPMNGSIRVTTTTTGTPVDPDGYVVAVDNGTPQPIAASGSIMITTTTGMHSVTLSGLATNCTVGDNPRTVTVNSGAVAEVSFAVTCGVVTELSWTMMQSGTDFSLLSVWGSSGSDVFVTGEPGGTFTSTIFHYDGQAWAPQFSREGITLYGVWGTAANNVFAVGSDPLGAFGYQGAILHFDGSAWAPVTTSGIGSGEVLYRAVWGSSATDVYAVGEDFTEQSNSIIAHFDGTSWSRVELAETSGRLLFDVHGSSATDVYAVGQLDQGDFLRRNSALGPFLRDRSVRKLQSEVALILHYDGSAWSERVFDEPGVAFFGVWSAGPGDAFAVGVQGDNGVVYHFNGTVGGSMPTPPVGPLLDVWGFSGSDVYAVGDQTILHYDGTRWTEVQATDSRLNGVWGSSPTDVFAVGSGGTILHGTPAVAGLR